MFCCTIVSLRVFFLRGIFALIERQEKKAEQMKTKRMQQLHDSDRKISEVWVSSLRGLRRLSFYFHSESRDSSQLQLCVALLCALAYVPSYILIQLGFRTYDSVRYGRHNNAWRNSGVESSLPPPCNVTGKWNSRKPGHTHIVLTALDRALRIYQMKLR